MSALINTVLQSREAANQLAAQLPVGPMSGALQMLQAGVSIEQMQGVMALQKEWEANEARKAYVADMAAFKLNPPEIQKTKGVGFANKDGTFTGYFHATLGDVAKAVVHALAQHGFSHSWETNQTGGTISVVCKITHRLGHSETTRMEAGADQSGKKNAIQAVASSITYMQRYTLLAACGLATTDIADDDGQGGGTSSPAYDAAEALTYWTSMVNAALTTDVLAGTRTQALAEFELNKNLAGWNALKPVIAAKRAELAAA